MFCPECRAEYRPGFTHCTDCDVDLVADLPESHVDIDCAELKHVWTGRDQERCVELCKNLKAAGIPFNVEESRHQYLNGVDEKYRISVPSEFFPKAKRIITKGQ